MYKIIGADQKEYGPVSAEQLRQWINEGRVNAQTRVLPEGTTEWKTLAELPEFAEAWIIRPPVAGAVPGFEAHAGLPADLFARDYDLDIGGCIGRSFEMFQKNMGTLIVATLLGYSPWILGGIVRMFGIIPVIGILFSLVGMVISLATLVFGGPLLGGLYSVFLKVCRGHPVVAQTDVFAGFRSNFGHLFLGFFLPGLFVGLCFIPAVVVFIATLIPSLLKHQQELPVGALIAFGVAMVLSLPVVLWLSINWRFTLALVIDQRLDFWTAMKTSWRQVSRHWWTVFGLTILVGLLNFAGLCACGVGLLFTTPIGLGAMMQAYEIIFSARAPEAGQGA